MAKITFRCGLTGRQWMVCSMPVKKGLCILCDHCIILRCQFQLDTYSCCSRNWLRLSQNTPGLSENVKSSLSGMGPVSRKPSSARQAMPASPKGRASSKYCINRLDEELYQNSVLLHKNDLQLRSHPRRSLNNDTLFACSPCLIDKMSTWLIKPD